MSCEHLICAACGGPVVEARCPVCRAGRERLHHHGGPSMSPYVLFALLAVVLVVALLADQALRG